MRLLRVFLVLMSERSVSRTAEHLGLSQPTTSHMLARLRRLFNDPLLLRGPAGMVATERASSIESAVRQVVRDYDALVGDARDFDPATSRKTFVLSAPEYAEHLLMPALMRRVRRAAPGVRLEVRAPDRDRALDLLQRGEVDLRIAWLPRPPTSLRFMPLFQDRIVCLAHRGHPGIHGSLTLAQYLDATHVRPLNSRGTTTAQVIDDAVERQGRGRKLDLALQVQNFLTIPLLLDQTDLIATVPNRLAQTFGSLEWLQVLESPLKLPRMRYAAYWHERNQREVPHRWLRGMVAEAAAELA